MQTNSLGYGYFIHKGNSTVFFCQVIIIDQIIPPTTNRSKIISCEALCNACLKHSDELFQTNFPSRVGFKNEIICPKRFAVSVNMAWPLGAAVSI